MIMSMHYTQLIVKQHGMINMFNKIGCKLAGLKCGIINYDEELQEFLVWINPFFQGWQQAVELELVMGLALG